VGHAKEMYNLNLRRTSWRCRVLGTVLLYSSRKDGLMCSVRALVQYYHSLNQMSADIPMQALRHWRSPEDMRRVVMEVLSGRPGAETVDQEAIPCVFSPRDEGASSRDDY
jgi:hypothetical protein